MVRAVPCEVLTQFSLTGRKSGKCQVLWWSKPKTTLSPTMIFPELILFLGGSYQGNNREMSACKLRFWEEGRCFVGLLAAATQGLPLSVCGLANGQHYNNVRLNSAIGYIAPKDMLAGISTRFRPSGGGSEGTAEESPPAGRVMDETDYFRLGDNTSAIVKAV